ncbi:MAG: KEOPS complex N(6)-L-threonylcarbamoyladenine synthase Kae1 [Candidatus Aenigmatarchaeota archaeon]
MEEKLICLGIESTAHTFAIGIVDEEGNILADVREIYKPTKGWGIIPHEAALHHKKIKEEVCRSALEKANLKFKDIDIIAYSCGPGLFPCLKIGAEVASTLSKKIHKPLIKIHHAIGHIEIGRLLTKAKDPVILLLSGGHNMILAYVEGRYRVFGEVLDITCGNLFDTIARKMGLEMPGGPKIEQLAKLGKNYVELPIAIKGMDVSFSGIQTAAINLLKNGVPKEDIAYSLQETCFAALVETTERAMAHTGKQECLVTGGVAANRRLREMISLMCEERGAKAFFVPPEYSGDNAVMIAWVGLLVYKHCKPLPKIKDRIKPKWRIDEVEITWL